MLARSSQLFGVFQPIGGRNVPSYSAVYPNPTVGGRECPVLRRRWFESLACFSLSAAGNVPSCSAVYPNPADGGRECPVLLAPLVRILLSLAVNVGLFSAVCT